jgi:hypothetical protein
MPIGLHTSLHVITRAGHHLASRSIADLKYHHVGCTSVLQVVC